MSENLHYPSVTDEDFSSKSPMGNETNQEVALIKEHLARRPAMEPRDVYKLLYQGTRGPEHIIASPKAFTERKEL